MNGYDQDDTGEHDQQSYPYLHKIKQPGYDLVPAMLTICEHKKTANEHQPGPD